jgi:hypothetical protein
VTETTTPSDQSARPPVRQRTRPIPPPPSSPSPPSAGQLLQAPPKKTAAKASARRPRPPAPPSVTIDDDKVGYRNPPKHSRFKPGFDPRRPKGREPGAKNKASSIVAMMESPTTVRAPNGGVKTISTAEALARKLRELGLQGELGAIAKAFELYHKASLPAAAEAAGKHAASAQSPDELSASDQAILAAFEEEIAARKATGKQP